MKKTYVTLSIIIMLLSLLAACREFISKTEFDKLYDDWEKAVENADNSGITFIPILD